MGPKEALEASWRPLRAPKASLSAKEGIPGANAALSGPQKISLDRILAAQRPILREVSANLEAKRPPKGRPRGCKIESKRRLKLKMRVPLKPWLFP